LDGCCFRVSPCLRAHALPHLPRLCAASTCCSGTSTPHHHTCLPRSTLVVPFQFATLLFSAFLQTGQFPPLPTCRTTRLQKEKEGIDCPLPYIPSPQPFPIMDFTACNLGSSSLSPTGMDLPPVPGRGSNDRYAFTRTFSRRAVPGAGSGLMRHFRLPRALLRARLRFTCLRCAAAARRFLFMGGIAGTFAFM